jgi:hypothetical protein
MTPLTILLFMLAVMICAFGVITYTRKENLAALDIGICHRNA